MSQGLKGSQRKHLRGLAHGLKPVVHIGRQGLSPTCLENLDVALRSHELIKIKFVDFQDQKAELLQKMERRLRAEIVGTIGHTAILYRQHPDPEARKVKLPSG